MDRQEVALVVREAKSRVAVVGVGAIGGVLAAGLDEGGHHDLILCARSSFDEVRVEYAGSTARFRRPTFFAPESLEEREDPVDWILLATKAHQSASALPWLSRLSGSGTRIAVLQNGVDHMERMVALGCPAHAVVPVIVQLAAERFGAGRIRQESPARLTVADDAGGRDFAELFAGTRIDVRVRADFHTQAWWKLIMNAALGGIEALTLRDNRVARDLEIREIVLILMREAAAVGRAEGAELPADAPEKVLDLVLGTAAGHWASIAVDRREGHPMEWEVRNEIIGRLGRRHGIATAVNDLVTHLLRVADVGWSPPSDPA